MSLWLFPVEEGSDLDADDQRAQTTHEPVLLREVVESLCHQPGGLYIDGTLGPGGHAEAVLSQSAPTGRLLGLDRDPQALAVAQSRLQHHGRRVDIVHGSFAHLEAIATERGFLNVQGILLDLGLSSLQLADETRGFSFQIDAPLDMRFDPSQEVTAADLVNGLLESALADIIFQYGEERRSRRIARAIVKARPIMRTGKLAQVVTRAVGRRTRIHPATKTFQSLRVAVNRELEALEQVLPQAVDLLAPDGRLAVICFHSLEDRIVKRFLRRESRDCICSPEIPVCMCDHRATLRVITRRPVRPSVEQVHSNPRSRSARLRVAARLP